MVTTPDNSLFLGQRGPLTGVLMLHVNFNNVHVACLCPLIYPLNLRNGNVLCHYIIRANVAVAKDHVAL